MNLPFGLDIARMQTKWKSIIDPILSLPILNGQLISGVTLQSGDNTINHGLGRALVGYIPVMNSSAATFYDKQATNPRTALTLVLNASATSTVSLWVF